MVQEPGGRAGRRGKKSPPNARAGRVPIKFVGLEESPLIFANHILVQHTEHEFIISFGQIQPPVILDPTADEISKVKFVESKIAVRIVLPPTRVDEFLQILGQNYSNFLGQVGALESVRQEGEENAADND